MSGTIARPAERADIEPPRRQAIAQRPRVGVQPRHPPGLGGQRLEGGEGSGGEGDRPTE